jgi:hypothetical protein
MIKRFLAGGTPSACDLTALCGASVPDVDAAIARGGIDATPIVSTRITHDNVATPASILRFVLLIDTANSRFLSAR